MPTKIVSTTSDPLNGEINLDDLRQITDDFETLVVINSTTSRAFQKVNTVSVPIPILEHLLLHLTAAEKIDSKVNINFGVTLPGQKDCTDGVTDVENHLTVVMVVEKEGVPQDQVGDFIITAGFREHSMLKIADGACCPVIDP